MPAKGVIWDFIETNRDIGKPVALGPGNGADVRPSIQTIPNRIKMRYGKLLGVKTPDYGPRLSRFVGCAPVGRGSGLGGLQHFPGSPATNSGLS